MCALQILTMPSPFFYTRMMIGNVITHENPRDYKQAVAYTLAQDYGFTRIMSSYFFENSDQGPPSNGGYR